MRTPSSTGRNRIPTLKLRSMNDACGTLVSPEKASMCPSRISATESLYETWWTVPPFARTSSTPNP